MASPRFPLVLPVRFSFDAHAIQTTSQEISTEGALVRCLEPPPLDTEVKLRFYLPGAQAVAELTGRVSKLVSGAESGFWADFTSAAPLARERLYSLLAAQEGGAWRTPVPLGALYPRFSEDSSPVPLPGPKPAPVGPPSIEPIPAPATTAAPEEDRTPEEHRPPVLKLVSSAQLTPPGGASSEGRNRRSFPRHRARFLVRFESVQEFVLQYAANISAGGVFITTDFPPPMDSVITVILELPGGTRPVTARAQVVHRVTPAEAAATNTDAGAGVQFIDADDTFREGIDRSIEYILTEHPKDA